MWPCKCNCMVGGACIGASRFYFFFFPFFFYFNGPHKCPTNGRPFRICSEYFCLHPLSSFFFSQPPRPAAKINVCTGRPIRIDEARRPKNAMTADDPGVIFNFKCYEIENDSDLIGNSRGGQFITKFFLFFLFFSLHHHERRCVCSREVVQCVNGRKCSAPFVIEE